MIPTKRVIFVLIALIISPFVYFYLFDYSKLLDQVQSLKDFRVQSSLPAPGFKSAVVNIPKRLHWCDGKYTQMFPACRKSLTKELRFAYIQYATTPQYLCNSIIAFTRLREFETQAELGLLYPVAWNSYIDIPSGKKRLESRQANDIGNLLRRAQALKVNLHPIEVLSRVDQDPTWAESFTKLKVLELTQYDRVISLDSDGLIMKHMDHLFFSPLAAIAMPRAYWLNDSPNDVIAGTAKRDILSSQFMLLTPSKAIYDKMIELYHASVAHVFDMELMNSLGGGALILPHQGFDMVSGEYRASDHSKYLSDGLTTTWDADYEAENAYYVHFSDWPNPKPWFVDNAAFEKASPRCDNPDPSKPHDGCSERYHWRKLYTDYRAAAAEVCSG